LLTSSAETGGAALPHALRRTRWARVSGEVANSFQVFAAK